MLGLLLAVGACLTPVAPHEPPCNASLADSGWGASHRASYASGSSPYPAPGPTDQIVPQHVQLPGSSSQVPITIDFSSPYEDGHRVAWMSTASNPNVEAVHKIDVDTGTIIDSVSVPPMGSRGNVTGAYNLLDRENHLFVGRTRSLEVFGDRDPGHRESKIAKLATLQLPDGDLCGPTDKIVGLTMTYDGRVAFASERGAVGVVPRDLTRFTPANVKTLQLNHGHCDEADEDIEIVSNSIASDETGGIYVVTSKLLDRVQWDGRNLSLKWAGHYNVGPPASGVRLGDGSGSTPDVMGTSRDKDRFVVITDGGPLMNLDLFWRDRIPKHWKPIAPGKDRRLACEVPVTFGDPSATRSISEQSVLTNGYTSVVVNNALKDEAALNALPPAQRQIAAALAGQDPLNAPYGIERIDWNPKTRACRPVWSNREVSIPNAIPTLSTASGTIYGQGQVGGAWGLDGIDLATGEMTIRTEASTLPSSNSLYAATEVGPDGAVWQGTAGGIDIYRGPSTAPPPRLRCFDLTPPTLSKLRVKVISRRVKVRAKAGDRACGMRAPVRLRTTVDGRRQTRQLAPGRHRVRVIAVDRAGLASHAKILPITVA